MKFLLRFLTWWNFSTLNTAFFTWRNGVKVGEDEQGNVYYRSHDSKKRWVIYNGLAEASMIPPGWHGWMHHIVDTPPTEEKYKPRPWQKPHRPNLTGTPGAYLANPAGLLLDEVTASSLVPVDRDGSVWQSKGMRSRLR